MGRTCFKSYSIATPYDNRVNSYPLDHVFVVSDEGHNRSYFGRGKEVIPQALLARHFFRYASR